MFGRATIRLGIGPHSSIVPYDTVMAPDVAENLEVGFLYCCTECTGQRNNFELIPTVTGTHQEMR